MQSEIDGEKLLSYIANQVGFEKCAEDDKEKSSSSPTSPLCWDCAFHQEPDDANSPSDHEQQQENKKQKRQSSEEESEPEQTQVEAETEEKEDAPQGTTTTT